jgi:hypothetical protein
MWLHLLNQRVRFDGGSEVRMAFDVEVVALAGNLSPFRPVVSIAPCPYQP